jgi:glycine betaine/proline transport system ATP-binding protein
MELQREFLTLKQRLHKTMLLVTHDLNEALVLGDRIAVMRHGVLLQVGSAEELKNKPADDYVHELWALARRART